DPRDADGREHLDEGDAEHHRAGAQDVAGVSLRHAVVDDPAVEARQRERRQGGGQLEEHEADDEPGPAAQVGAPQPQQHGHPLRSTPCSTTSTISAGVSGSAAVMWGWAPEKLSSRTYWASRSGLMASRSASGSSSATTRRRTPTRQSSSPWPPVRRRSDSGGPGIPTATRISKTSRKRS